MNRRSFIKGLALLPCLGFLKGKDKAPEFKDLCLPSYRGRSVLDSHRIAEALSEQNAFLRDAPFCEDTWDGTIGNCNLTKVLWKYNT